MLHSDNIIDCDESSRKKNFEYVFFYCYYINIFMI